MLPAAQIADERACYQGRCAENVIHMYKNHFLEILQKTSVYLEMVFGLDVTEMDPCRSIYIFVHKLELSYDAMARGNRRIPKTGL